MAISDAKYKFIYVNVGAYGSEGDGGVFCSDTIGRKINNDELPLPDDATLGGIEIPYFFIADDAFALSKRIMKPYTPTRAGPLSNEENIFNYRLSRARRCIENAFGILSRKWLCLSHALRHHPKRASKIILACCVLHNLLIDSTHYCPTSFADYIDGNGDIVEGEWRSKRMAELLPLQNASGRIANRPKEIRDCLSAYVNSEIGSVPWQNTIFE